MTHIRKILVTTMGHVDHGKSSVLDYIRGSTIVEREAGKITQAIGASIIPIATIQRICGKLLDSLNMNLTIPGILAIDTPGHAAFTNLRKRGGSLADIAILVVDVNEGFKPQTVEAIEILKRSKTPFVVAANKIDLLQGWRHTGEFLIPAIAKLDEAATTRFETKLYELVGKLSEMGLQAERFDRVEDYTKQIPIVPTSAQTGDGIPELLMVITGLAQRFMEHALEVDVTGPAKGTILEVKEEKGLGITIDVIIYDGKLKVNEILVIGGVNEPVVTKVKALLEPIPLAEMMDKKSKYRHVNEVSAATGVKIAAQGIKEVVAGMPIAVATQETLEQVKEQIQKQVQEVLIETDKEGIIIKADTLGGLEALVTLLKEKGITIRHASVGTITKKDISNAESNYDLSPLTTVILGFNVDCDVGVGDSGNVKVLINNVIYKLIDDFEEWQKKRKDELEADELSSITRPWKIEIMSGYIFRQSNPAVVGVNVEAGTLRSNTQVMSVDGKIIGTVKGIQVEQKNVDKAEVGKQVAVSIDGPTVGRQINEGDILYCEIPEEDFKKLKEFKQYLGKDEKEILKIIAQIKREYNPVWGI
ncbi:MAG: translation initiation factor IF-2 [Nanoarchaeota archaeon]|nr:translation initiation factor IF-2 [Nanoarchaeota archaeon]